ncbi:MAG: hypothetical protein EA353_07700 [Puniceicoccaceae bacterium]|nr:MAG: hypothetical protein EA353_07700 [Puniceicoccaceae bacterium]
MNHLARLLFYIFGFGLAWVPWLHGQVPLLVDRVAEVELEDSIQFEWKRAAAEQAQAAGLASLAESIYASLLRTPSAAGMAQSADLKLGLVKALLAQGRFVAARNQLELIPESLRGARYGLYRSIAIYGEGGPRVDVESFRAALETVVEEALQPEDIAWLSFVNGLSAELAGDSAGAQAVFAEAAERAASEMLRLHFESLALRQEIVTGPANESLVADLGARLRSLEGQSAAYPYVREYAVLLSRLGRDAEALGAIDRELANTSAGYGASQREQLRLLKGLILGADSVTGRAALKELIRNGENRDAMGIALQMLARAQDADDDLFEFLRVMISRSERHPLLGQMFYLRSQLALRFPNDPEMMAIAESDARTLLDEFPGLSSITNVYRLLAYGALNREPPQYRTAADFLIQLRDQTEQPGELVVLNSLIGDCYFLNGDFVNAVDFYTAARNRQLPSDQADDLFMRLVTAQVRSGSVEAAMQLIDQADFAGNIRLQDRWRAEWNLAQALQATGAIELALQRVRLLLAESVSGQIETFLDIRLRWLEAHLSLEAAETEGLVERISALLSRLQSLPRDDLEAGELLLLETEIRLLRGDARMRLGDADGGIAELKELRERFGSSAAAQRSYLIEAAYHSTREDLLSAQQTLTSFVELYPQSPLAAQALFEAALYCELRGPDYYSEAIVLHNQLADRYAGDPLYYYARLKQGNLLRSMNDFAGAQIVYENLINRYPTHELRYLAELSRADCLLALAGNQPGELLDAVVQLERLLDLPRLPLDFQAEASFKWAFALQKSGATAKAKEVLSLAVARFLLDGIVAEELGAPGRYWLARSVLTLGEILEAEASVSEARRLYRKMIAYNLPGRQIAVSRVDRLIEID